MEDSSKSFTLQSYRILRVLNTECGVCEAFDPLSEGKHPDINRYITVISNW